jgi:hypothetical protein
MFFHLDELGEQSFLSLEPRGRYQNRAARLANCIASIASGVNRFQSADTVQRLLQRKTRFPDVQTSTAVRWTSRRLTVGRISPSTTEHSEGSAHTFGLGCLILNLT